MDLDVIGKIAEHGLVGAVAAGAIWIAWRKDTELATEKAARIEDAQKVMATLLASQEKAVAMTANLDKIADRLEADGAERVRLLEERDRARAEEARVEREVAVRVGRATPPEAFSPMPVPSGPRVKPRGR